MVPTPEQKQHMEVSQKAAFRNAQTFSMFTMMVASDMDPREALSKALAAMDIWLEYETEHTIDPPEMPSYNELALDMLAKTREFMDESDKRRERQATHDELFSVDPRDLIAASQDFSNNRYAGGGPADAFTCGAAMMLKMLHGDPSPEPWADYYDHARRLEQLLTEYDLVAPPLPGPDEYPEAPATETRPDHTANRTEQP